MITDQNERRSKWRITDYQTLINPLSKLAVPIAPTSSSKFLTCYRVSPPTTLDARYNPNINTSINVNDDDWCSVTITGDFPISGSISSVWPLVLLEPHPSVNSKHEWTGHSVPSDLGGQEGSRSGVEKEVETT